MSKTLERIWVQKDASGKGPMTAFYHVGSWPGERTEYVRADRIEELEAKLAKAVEAAEELFDVACLYREEYGHGSLDDALTAYRKAVDGVKGKDR